MIDSDVRLFVRARAGLRCEYCQLAEAHSPLSKLQIEHVLPRKHGGDDDPDNLGLACIDCNLRKGTNLTGLDPQGGAIVALFSPRRQTWDEHFVWRGELIEGLTDVGRTTVRVLDLNSAGRIQARIAIG